MNWQPIETGPKDGTEVLGYDGKYWLMIYREEITKPKWARQAAGWFDVEVTEEWCRLSPTHWMPLPTPPEIEA